MNRFEPPKARAGEEVGFKDGDREWVQEVLPACDINTPNSGHWYCSTHREGVNPNFPTAAHGGWRVGCRAVWICHTHGPEQP